MYDSAMKVSTPIKKLILSYLRTPHRQTSADEPRLNVRVTVSRFSYIYERIRNAIEYKDEHLLRKNAIERMLKRRIYNEIRRNEYGRLLLTELIQARYLHNNVLPESVVGEVDIIVNKYLGLLRVVAPNRLTKDRRQAGDWLLSIMAAEIDHHLVGYHKDEAMVECMYRVMRQDFDLTEEITDEKERNYQVFVAIHRALIKSDQAIVRYHLLKFILPGWFTNDPTSIEHFGKHFYRYRHYIDHQVDHPLKDKLMRQVKRFSIVFNVLRDVIDEYGTNFESLVDDPEDLEAQIRAAVERRYTRARLKLNRSYTRAIVYIFITKMLLALLIELPYDIFILKTPHYTPLLVNALFHPFLMLIIALSISTPGKKNTDKIVEWSMKIIQNEPHPGFLLNKRKTFTRNAFLTGLFRTIYGLTFLISFGLILWVLSLIHFNLVSSIVFIFFFAVISFFGVRLRGEMRDLVIVDKNVNAVTFTIDFFTVPIIHLGRWISEKSPKINVFLFILDGIIETPLKVVMESLEEWGSYQQEKKEEIY